jgi:hypothetical protein
MFLSAKIRKESASVEYLISSRGSVTRFDLLRTSIQIPDPTEALLLGPVSNSQPNGSGTDAEAVQGSVIRDLCQAALMLTRLTKCPNDLSSVLPAFVK